MFQAVPILTYHSISDASGPTSMPAPVFRAQMETLAELGVDVVGLDWVEKWMKGDASPRRRTVAITFDDAFTDFAEAAFPILSDLRFPACVFTPTALIGDAENWRGANSPPRTIMSWNAIRDLSQSGVEFGSHARTHCDLTTLDAAGLDAELGDSRRELEDAVGKSAPHFAPPYGRSNGKVRKVAAKYYSMSVGVRLDEATRKSPLFDIPRVEMHYFRDIKLWRSFLAGEGGVYFHARRAGRGLRDAARVIKLPEFS